MSKCKITVLRKMLNKDFARQYCLNPETTVCTAFKEGQTFLLANQDKPAGFCEEAWSAITRYAFAFVNGGGGFFHGNWMTEENTMIACCNDGIRPVVFKLERIDD